MRIICWKYFAAVWPAGTWVTFLNLCNTRKWGTSFRQHLFTHRFCCAEHLSPSPTAAEEADGARSSSSLSCSLRRTHIWGSFFRRRVKISVKLHDTQKYYRIILNISVTVVRKKHNSIKLLVYFLAMITESWRNSFK